MGGFEQLVGQPQVVALLEAAIARDRVAPAYLFAGATGVGKALAAVCFLQILLGETTERRIAQRNHPDLLWVEPTYLDKGKRLTAAAAEVAGVKKRAAPIVRLEQIREVTQFLSRPPLEADRSVVVIEAAESMPEAAANALLKTLEEPGPATIILLAPNVEMLLPTLVSRCQRIPFYRLALAAMTQVLVAGRIYGDSEPIPGIGVGPGKSRCRDRPLAAAADDSAGVVEWPHDVATDLTGSIDGR